MTKSDLEEGRVISGKESKLSPKSPKDKYSKEDSKARYIKLFFCFTGLQVSYLTWGFIQENLMTKDYALGKFKSSAFLVFCNRLFALIIALVIVVVMRINTKTPIKEAPYYYYIPSSISNSLSSWAQYEALKYISFPTQVLSKCCKIIPVMLVGIIINKKAYPWSEYLEAAMITTGVMMFTYSEKSSKMMQHDGSEDQYPGILLLCLYLICDSFTSQWQSRVYKQFKIDQFQMMLGVNIWSIIMTGLTVFQSGEFFASIAFIMSDFHAFVHMTILSLTSAIGQLFIFYTVKEFGPVIFTIIMTTRQIISLFLSCLFFGHSLQFLGFFSALSVFAIVINRIMRKIND